MDVLTLLLSVVVGLPLLLLVEILLLLFCGIRCLPPLSCMLNKSPLTGTFDISTMPPHPQIPDELLSKKQDVSVCGMKWYEATGSVAEAVKTSCELMLAYTVVSTTSRVPEVMSGVFWMDGNKVPEELACLAYEAVGEQGSSFLVNKVNSTVSWTYLNSSIGKFIAWFQEKDDATGMQVFTFDSPECLNGRIWSCTTFNYEDINWLTSIGNFSMERLPGPGVNYKRGCYWFDKVFGKRLEYGSYTLRKIMSTDGTPVQPAYDDFVKYMETKNTGLSQITEAPPSSPEGEKAPLAAAA
mmetsp:Transcript_123824/g.309510  ORF Transcript_123824/g.309510 Transcript_123824/m.309510 type:complete len:297 (-) Transcript_123824:65-955(-)